MRKRIDVLFIFQKIQYNPRMFGENVLSWETVEYEFEKKSPDWFWALGIIALASGLTAVLFGNYLFGVFIIMAAVLLGFYAIRRPQTVHYDIGGEGVRAGAELYPYKNLKAFWLETEGSVKKLLLLSGGSLSPILTLPLGDVSPLAVKEALAKNLPERKLSEPLSHLIMEHLGF